MSTPHMPLLVLPGSTPGGGKLWELTVKVRDPFGGQLGGVDRSPEPGERVLCAAIHVEDGKPRPHQPTTTGIVYCGHRHHNIFDQLQPAFGLLESDRKGAGVLSETQGFLTSTGRFVNRKQAMKIALAADQLLEGGEALLPGGQLDSCALY